MDAPIPTPALPKPIAQWLKTRGWHLHAHQLAMLAQAKVGRSCLLVAPTGSGKTLAGFMPTLVDLHEHPLKGIHTLYVSPLKALAQDIQRNLVGPVEEMGLPIEVLTLTGDTSSHARQKMRKSGLPGILLTTPESLTRLLSYPDSFEQFKSLKTIIVDEIHAFAGTKRGEQMALAMARLYRIAPHARHVGLSATVAKPQALADWLARPGEITEILYAEDKQPPKVTILKTKQKLPLGGHFPRHAMGEIMELIAAHNCTILFMNTRAQAEMLFQALWDKNDQGLAIGLHHGSLIKEQRLRVEAAMAAGALRAVVATAALDLGVDWGNVDLVVQIGAPKGISRLLQRIGRSNHRPDLASKAVLVPTNCFEVVECVAAIDAIAARQRDDTPPKTQGSLDVLAQHLVNCACAEPFFPDDLYAEVRTTYPFADLRRAQFDAVLRYVMNGGYALRSYDRYYKLSRREEDGRIAPTGPRIPQRHRMNIGTIVESETLKVLRVTSRPEAGRRAKGGGTVLGEVEESFITHMQPGDTFMFAGQLLEYIRIREMMVEVMPKRGNSPKIPAYAGGKMPMSSFLAERVRHLIQDYHAAKGILPQVKGWLAAQEEHSELPPEDGMLIECFPRDSMQYVVMYPFEGRPAHQALGLLATWRMEKMGLKPVGFCLNDYSLAIWGLVPPTADQLRTILHPTLLEDELEGWLERSALLKRTFRNTAVIAGLIERRMPGQERKRKALTISTDLLYDVLHKHEPSHILLAATRLDAERDLIDLPRLYDCLQRVQGHIQVRDLPHISPLAIPVMLEMTTDSVEGDAVGDFLSSYARMDARAEVLLAEATAPEMEKK